MCMDLFGMGMASIPDLALPRVFRRMINHVGAQEAVVDNDEPYH